MRVQVIHETTESYGDDGWNIAFQWCQYVHDNGENEFGYRFIWRDPDNKMRPMRGQTRLPSIPFAEKLIQQAKQLGWGELDEDNPRP